MKYLWKLILIVLWGYIILFKLVVLFLFYLALTLWHFNYKTAFETVYKIIIEEDFLWFSLQRDLSKQRSYKSISDLWNSKVWVVHSIESKEPHYEE